MRNEEEKNRSFATLGMTARCRSRRAMSMLEVVVAMSILGGALLSMAAFTARLSHSTGAARMQGAANQLVNDRMETVKGAPRYSAIESLFVKTESNIPGFKGYTRRTLVTHTGGKVTDSIDFKTVTVEVTNPQLTKAVRKSTVIAPF